ncbi:MAG: hypothetical protein R3253_13680, partial [Longimicrobiales bacterium]|nr:hypothetical protein [Longimicrobiales bacterium]
VVTRAGGQLLMGTLLGAILAAFLLRVATFMPWEVRQGNPAALLVVVAALVLSGAAALARPLSRALSIRPADAMRVE